MNFNSCCLGPFCVMRAPPTACVARFRTTSVYLGEYSPAHDVMHLSRRRRVYFGCGAGHCDDRQSCHASSMFGGFPFQCIHYWPFLTQRSRTHAPV
ncbi:unnamed protein product [Ectocarpus sp. 8 AP-2014]